MLSIKHVGPWIILSLNNFDLVVQACKYNLLDDISIMFQLECVICGRDTECVIGGRNTVCYMW